VERFVGDVVAVMDDMRIENTHCIGYSAGGSIALTLTKEVRNNYMALPNATIVSFPGMNHDQLLTQSDVILPHIKEFLAHVRKA
jgi:pimeloyl-ACP methyl ester carboxylesterase